MDLSSSIVSGLLDLVSDPPEEQLIDHNFSLDRSSAYKIVLHMDVSQTDHPHLIGKQGRLVKEMNLSTSCAIHYPENSKHSKEKKNDVTINGNDIDMLELARCRIREMSPFQITVTFRHKGFGDEEEECLNFFRLKHSVEITKVVNTHIAGVPKLVYSMRSNEFMHENVIKCAEDLLHRLGRSKTQSTTFINIQAQHENLVFGPNRCNLSLIEQKTGTVISTTYLYDKKLPSDDTIKVTIEGHPRHVYTAKQLIIGSLPLYLSFDARSSRCDISRATAAQEIKLTEEIFGVAITVLCSKGQPKIIVIKGIEREAGNVYQARNFLFEMNSLLGTYVFNMEKYLFKEAIANLRPAQQYIASAIIRNSSPYGSSGFYETDTSRSASGSDISTTSPDCTRPAPRFFSRSSTSSESESLVPSLFSTLSDVGLGCYYKMFAKHDLQSFLKLKENNLQKMGITAVIEKATLLTAIADLNQIFKEL